MYNRGHSHGTRKQRPLTRKQRERDAKLFAAVRESLGVSDDPFWCLEYTPHNGPFTKFEGTNTEGEDPCR